MIKRRLGIRGFDVAPLAFGGNVFGWIMGAAGLELDAAAIEQLNRASA